MASQGYFFGENFGRCNIRARKQVDYNSRQISRGESFNRQSKSLTMDEHVPKKLFFLKNTSREPQINYPKVEKTLNEVSSINDNKDVKIVTKDGRNKSQEVTFTPITGYQGFVPRIASENIYGVTFEKSLTEQEERFFKLQKWKNSETNHIANKSLELKKEKSKTRNNHRNELSKDFTIKFDAFQQFFDKKKLAI